MKIRITLATLLVAAVAGGGVTAFAMNGNEGGTVVLEQVASQPSETTEPAPVVTTSEPAPVVTPEPVVSTSAPVAKENTVAPKPEPIAPDDPIRQTAPPPIPGNGPHLSGEDGRDIPGDNG